MDSSEAPKEIGYVVGGGLKESFRVRLTVPSLEVQEGAFVVIEGGSSAEGSKSLFYGLVTDMQLGSTNPRFADEQSETRLPSELAHLLHGQTLFTNLEVLPSLMLECPPEIGTEAYDQWWREVEAGLREKPRPMPVKTVPPHHSIVRMASAGDIAEIFGKAEEKGNFVLGYTREQGHPICIQLDKFVQRSAGIFGATGTGKSFLTRILLAGLIHHNTASVLLFDMHNEYAYRDTASDTGLTVPGLREKFPTRVRVVGLGRGTFIRDQAPDFHLEIAMRDIQPQDIELLTRELNLKETTPTVLDALVSCFGKTEWFKCFKELKTDSTIVGDDGKRKPAEDSVKGWAEANGVHPMAAEGLHSKLSKLFNRPYIVEDPAADSLGEIIKALDSSQHVILSFGKYETDLDYLFVTNLLTRRIRERWEERVNSFRSGSKGKTDEPRPLVIVVEEAHKLLNREMAAQTTFSTIAREMRKYYVTLIIIDQRPSQIYDEVMSQLGTRICGWLGDEDDIHAVLSGLAGRDKLRGMLAHLQPKEEVLLLGWSVPMPIPLRSRRYDDRFWQELLGKERAASSIEQNLKALGF